jgi:hypothetical protein
MKYLLFVTLLAFFLFIPSCDLFEPKEEDVPEETDDNLLGTIVIGPAGGELDLDSLVVTVPSNAFNEDTELSVFVNTEDAGFDDYGLSPTYQISGLPNTLHEAIRFKIKYNGTIEGDTLVAIGEKQYATTYDELLTSYYTESATGSSGYLIYDLPANSHLKVGGESKTNKSDAYTLYMLIIGGYKRTLSSGGNFRLSYPIAYAVQGGAMGDHFEAALDTCKALGTSGFSLSGRVLADNPAKVLAKRLGSANGKYTYKTSNVLPNPNVTDQEIRNNMYYGRFSIDLATLNNDAKLRTVCGHEFLHLVQNLYEFSSPNVEPEQKWLKEATSVWIMEKFSPLPNYVPHSLNNREMYPFDGWQYADRGYARHGYGLSLIFKDIEETQGVDKIIEMYETIKNAGLPSQAVDPVDAVLSILNEPVETFWHGVLGSYVLGHYYDHQVNVKYLDKAASYTDTVTMDEQNRSHTLWYNYHDLSGKLFKVQSGDLSGFGTFPLSFTVDDPTNCGILVCKYKQGTNIVSIGEVAPGGTGQVVVADAKPIFDDGYEIVVLVSNCTHQENANYQGDNAVKLRIDSVGTDTLNGRLEFYLDTAEYRNSDSPTPYTADLHETLYLNDVSGSFSNNRFSGTYAYQSLGRSYSGYVSITFISDATLMNIRVDNTMTYESYIYGTVTIDYSINFIDIPYDGVNPTSGAFEYSESGPAVQRISVSWEETNNVYTKTLLNATCGADAYINVSVDALPEGK